MAMIATEANESRLVPVPGRVVGIDPGLNVTGYAVVEPSPRGPFVVEAGVIRPRSARGGMGQRLFYIHQANRRGAGRVSARLGRPGTDPQPRALPAHRDPDGPCAGGDHAGRGPAPDAGLRLCRDADQEDPDRQWPGPQGTDPARDHDRARPGRLPEPHDVADACAVALCHFHVSRNQRGLTYSIFFITNINCFSLVLKAAGISPVGKA